MLGGAALLSAVLFQKSYAAREAMVVVAALGVACSAVLLLLVFGFLVFRGTTGIFSWVRIQSAQWNGAPGDLAFAFSSPQRPAEKPVPGVS